MMRSIPLLAAALAPAFLPLASHAQAPVAAPPSADLLDFSQYPSPDALWLHLQDVRKGPKTRPATQEEYRTDMVSMTMQLAGGTEEFLKRYPDDPRKWDARLLQIETESAINTMEGRTDVRTLAGELQQLAAGTDTPTSIRAQARYELLGIAMRGYAARDPAATSAGIVAQLQQFIADFPTYPSLDMLKYTVAQTLAASDPAASAELLTELANSGEGKVADQARGELARMEKLKSPLDLHFTAVDGSDVDLSKMRGKVVLIDFWATWCGPCKAEMPNVLAAYYKLHDRGFEVVGISLDQDRNSLTSFTAANAMPWPQYFDGKGWQNSISSAYAVQQIPTMWLVNKKGYVVTTNGRVNLMGQVEKLLGE